MTRHESSSPQRGGNFEVPTLPTPIGRLAGASSFLLGRRAGGEEPAWWQEVLSGYDREFRHLESKKSVSDLLSL